MEVKRILKKGMSINCRTEEEREIFIEFANKEGHQWAGGGSLVSSYRGRNAPCSFQIEYKHRRFPHSVSTSYVDWEGEKITQIEASELFRNEIISRRIKNGRT